MPTEVFKTIDGPKDPRVINLPNNPNEADRVFREIMADWGCNPVDLGKTNTPPEALADPTRQSWREFVRQNTPITRKASRAIKKITLPPIRLIGLMLHR